TETLLDAIRSKREGVKLGVEWADRGDIINSAVERCLHPIVNPPMAVVLPSVLPLIYVDPVLVQQALIQIFDNAVKYSVAGSRIIVDAHTREGHLIIGVVDQGAGLTSAEKSKICDRFPRGERDAATTSGSGLGLGIANAFMAANAGKVTAVSEGPGLGTTVAIELPVTQTAVPQLESDSDE